MTDSAWLVIGVWICLCSEAPKAGPDGPSAAAAEALAVLADSVLPAPPPVDPAKPKGQRLKGPPNPAAAKVL